MTATPLDGDLRETIKQIRSNNKSLAGILTTGALDAIIQAVKASLDSIEMPPKKPERIVDGVIIVSGKDTGYNQALTEVKTALNRYRDSL